MTGDLAREMESHRRRALELLPQYFVPAAGLFSHKALLHEHGCRNVGTNPLYSAACLVGLATDASLEAHRVLSDIGDTCASTLAQTAEASDDLALLGAVVWALALLDDGRTPRLVERLAGLDERTSTSMGAGLALAGLAAASWREPRVSERALSIGRRFAATLAARFVPRAGVFASTSPAARRVDPLHRYVTSFASQIYPIVGLAEYALATSSAPLDCMFAAADSMRRKQGPLGQWWWIYSSRTGRVLEGYPVYVVHQDAMAVMALAGLARFGDYSNSHPLERGLRWLKGENELDRPLVSDTPAWYCRAIQRRGSDPDRFGGVSRAAHVRILLRSVVGSAPRGTFARPDRLEVLGEDRSYHLGWLLVAARLVRATSQAAYP
jgi:hypothetical protein